MFRQNKNKKVTRNMIIKLKSDKLILISERKKRDKCFKATYKFDFVICSKYNNLRTHLIIFNDLEILLNK